MTILIARILGVNDYGKLSFVTAIGSLVLPLVSLGSNNLIQSQSKKYCNNYLDEKIIGVGSTLQILGSIIIIPLFCLIAFLKNDTQVSFLLIFYWLSGICRSGEVIEYWLIGKGCLRLTAKGSIYSEILNILLKVIGIIWVKNLLFFGFISFIQCLAKSLIYVTYLDRFKLKLIKIIKKIKINNLTFYFLNRSIPVALQGLAITIFCQVDIIMISFMRNDEETAIYSFGCLAFAAITTIASSFAQQYYHQMSVNNFKSVKIYFRKLFFIGFIASILFIFGLKFAILIAGKEYLPANRLIFYLAPIVFTSTMGSGLGLTQIDERLEKEGLINTLIGAILNLILNYFLIPIINIEGAAIAFLLGSIMSGYLAPFTNKSHKSLAFKYYLNPIL